MYTNSGGIGWYEFKSKDLVSKHVWWCKINLKKFYKL